MVNIISGIGSFESFEKLKNLYSGKSILLVTGQASYKSSGAEKVLNSVLKNETVEKFSDFSVNPKLEDAERGVAIAIEANIEVIIAVGGGSVIDMAKLIKALYSTPNLATEIAKGEVSMTDPEIPLVVAPTTAGSGSEATHFAVVYIGADKYSLASSLLLPETVILDGKLTASGSSYQKACNGLDALSQAIESAWATGSTETSRQLSFKAVSLCVKYLKNVVDGANDEASLQGMLDAANLAGQAINTSKTTAAHAWSYGITSQYGLPHGHAVWLTLPAIFQIHANITPSKITDIRGAAHLSDVMSNLMNLLSISSSKQAARILRNYLTSIKIDIDMSKFGLDTTIKRKQLSQNVNMQRMGNNPVQFSTEDVNSIFDLQR